MPPRSSADRALVERETTSLKHLTTGLTLITDGGRLDVKSWEQIALVLNSVVIRVLRGRTQGRAGGLQWTSSPAGQAALECMKAIVEHAPAAMRTVTSSRQDRGAMGMGILVVPHAVCRVLDLCTQQHHVTLLAAWPNGIQSCTIALAKVAVLVPQNALNDPVVMSHISSSAYRDIDLPLEHHVDIMLILVRVNIEYPVNPLLCNSKNNRPDQHSCVSFSSKVSMQR